MSTTVGPTGPRRRRWLRSAVPALLLAPLLLLGLDPAPASAAPGALAVEAAPAEVAPGDPAVLVRVSNTGTGPVTSLTLTAHGRAGVQGRLEPESVPRLEPGTSALATLTLDGVPATRPASVVVVVSGTTEGGETVAMTAVGLVAAESTTALALVGNTRLTDASPADLVAVVTNSGETAATVTVRADAGGHVVRLAAGDDDVSAARAGEPIELTVGPRATALVQVRVEAQRPLRRGAAGLVVTATSETDDGAGPVDAVATREIDVALAADELPGVLGVGSIVVVPGLVAVWALLTVLTRDRRRIGLAPPAVGKRIWDDKLWMLAAVTVSLAAAWLYALVGAADLLDTYTVSDIVVVSVTCGLLAAGGAALRVWWHRRAVPAVTPTSSPLAVLGAAAKADPALDRPVYRDTGGACGLLVHTDGEAMVLTPPVEYMEMDVRDQERSGRLADVAAVMATQPDAEHRMRFQQKEGWLPGPTPVPGATPAGNERLPLTRPVDVFD
ncbi:hypothetical protein GCM10010531_07800 [Blastococcus jejuensis]|uniref:Uncharacterized protein n=1 Tax=Blastococcus jejuensis TaxID=351224 RepID=A0ABP6NV43_9ACTN